MLSINFIAVFVFSQALNIEVQDAAQSIGTQSCRSRRQNEKHAEKKQQTPANFAGVRNFATLANSY